MTKPMFKFTEDTSDSWMKDPVYNQMFIKTIQNHSNDLLRIHGYLFLNDVLQNLGLKKTQEGQVTGWIIHPQSSGFVHIEYEELDDQTGYQLTFNVDGVILDKVEF